MTPFQQLQAALAKTTPEIAIEILDAVQAITNEQYEAALQIFAPKKQYDFTGKAVKCDTWEQLNELAELAAGIGLESRLMRDLPQATFFSRSGIGIYTNYERAHPSETIISYTDFINNK